jgi:hypothetical protein
VATCCLSNELAHALVLSLSKDELFGSWFDKLTTSEMSKRFSRASLQTVEQTEKLLILIGEDRP